MCTYKHVCMEYDDEVAKASARRSSVLIGIDACDDDDDGDGNVMC